jgi:Protein of unknown function (DUF4231)
MAEDEGMDARGYSQLEAVGQPTLEERVLTRLENYGDFYHHHASLNHKWYLGIKVVQLVTAALIPIVATLRTSAWLTATLGGLILVLEGIQQTFQFQDRWIGYRSTWHTLDIERSLYEAGPVHIRILERPIRYLLIAWSK